MTTIERYAEDHPALWQQSGLDVKVFATLLALNGLINYADVQWLIWEHEQIHGATPGPAGRTLDELIKMFPQAWADSDEDPVGFVQLLYFRRSVTPEEYTRFMTDLGFAETMPPARPGEPTPTTPAEMEKLRAQIAQQMFELQKPWYQMTAQEMLKQLWEWLKVNVGELVDLLWGHIRAAFEQHWPPVRDKLEEAGRQIADWTNKALLSIGPVTPEDAATLGLKMFGLALGAGVGAHALSVGLEFIHPFKELGFGQIAGMLGQFASFGPVCAATLGVVHYAALRRPMQYAVNKVTRSQLPDDQLLQIMAVKPDIDLQQFRDTMKYHGFSDYWIERIEATMYHEPRYFELKMMSEDEAATDAWLYTKSRRAGFSEADAKIMVSSYLKTASRTQRVDFYRQAFYLYKEGFIDRGLFDRYLDELEFRPEAKQFAARAADLAYTLDTVNDSIKYWTDCYSKDLIDEDELAAHLSLLGVTPSRAWLIRQRAIIKKTKKPGQPAPTELEKAQSKIQTQYAQAYVTLYRKDLIDEDTLIADLIAIGIVPELAEATAALEAVRKIPAATA